MLMLSIVTPPWMNWTGRAVVGTPLSPQPDDKSPEAVDSLGGLRNRPGAGSRYRGVRSHRSRTSEPTCSCARRCPFDELRAHTFCALTRDRAPGPSTPGPASSFADSDPSPNCDSGNFPENPDLPEGDEDERESAAKRRTRRKGGVGVVLSDRELSPGLHHWQRDCHLITSHTRVPQRVMLPPIVIRSFLATV
jgi:hypothetical protein